MSNRKNPVGRAAALSLAACVALSSCSGVRRAGDERPYAVGAQQVVASVATHTPMSSACRRLAEAGVEARIVARLSSAPAEVASARRVGAQVEQVWDDAGCPQAALPGLRFGAGKFVSNLSKGAPGTPALL